MECPVAATHKKGNMRNDKTDAANWKEQKYSRQIDHLLN